MLQRFSVAINDRRRIKVHCMECECEEDHIILAGEEVCQGKNHSRNVTSNRIRRNLAGARELMDSLAGVPS